MKRLLILSLAAALALCATAVALAHGPGGHRPAARLGALGWGSGELQAWRDCLAKQGLGSPERKSEGRARKHDRPSAADLEKRKAAFEACKQYLPAPVREAQDAVSKFRDCLQKQGLPARPAPGSEPSDADKAKRKAAFEACLPAPVKQTQDAFAKYRECLRDQGLPGPGTKPSDADKAKRKAAFEACKQYLPAPVREAQDAISKFRDCLQKQGLPARPAPGSEPSDADRAKRKAAFEACKSLLPVRPHAAHTMRFR